MALFSFVSLQLSLLLNASHVVISAKGVNNMQVGASIRIRFWRWASLWSVCIAGETLILFDPGGTEIVRLGNSEGVAPDRFEPQLNQTAES